MIPDDVRGTLVLSDAMLERELLRLTDRYTAELFALDPATTASVVFGVSRLVVDPERFTDDALEPIAGRGMGAAERPLKPVLLSELTTRDPVARLRSRHGTGYALTRVDRTLRRENRISR
jgi:hypothetical protein